MATRVNLVIDAGTTFSTDIDVLDANSNPVDLSSFSGAASLKKTYTSTNSYSFSVNLTSNGVITLSMANTVTSRIWPGRYVYDVRVVDTTNNVSRVVEGIVTITPKVTD